jgi:Single-strand binding protein family
VRGIQTAFTGRVGRDAELKTSKAGKPWVSFSVAVDEASEGVITWIRGVMFGEWATELYPQLRRNTEVYCEGRLKFESWVGRDGKDRSGLSATVTKLVVLGRIGFDPHPRGPTEAHPPVKQPELEGHGRTGQDLPF